MKKAVFKQGRALKVAAVERFTKRNKVGILYVKRLFYKRGYFAVKWGYIMNSLQKMVLILVVGTFAGGYLYSAAVRSDEILSAGMTMASEKGEEKRTGILAPRDPGVTHLHDDKTTALDHRNVIMLLDSGTESTSGGSGFVRYAFNAALDYARAFIVVSGSVLQAWFYLGAKYKDYADKNRRQHDELQEALNRVTRVLNDKHKKRNPYSADTSTEGRRYTMELRYRIDQARTLLAQDPEFKTKKEELDKQEKALKEYEADLAQFQAKRRAISDAKQSALMGGYDCYVRRELLEKFNLFYCNNTSEYILIPKSFDVVFVTSSCDINNSLVLTKVSLEIMKKQVGIWGPTHYKSSWCGQMGQNISQWFKTIRSSRYSTIQWKVLKRIFVPQSDGWIFFFNGHGEYTQFDIQKRDKEILLPSHISRSNGIISGLSLEQHQDKFRFFGTTIKALAVSDQSCFVGGYHNALSVQMLQALKQHKDFFPFVYMSLGLTDSETGNEGAPCSMEFASFFNELWGFFQQQKIVQIDEKQAAKSDDVLEQNEHMKKSLIAVICVRNILNMPLVYRAGMVKSVVVDISSSAQYEETRDCLIAIMQGRDGSFSYNENKAILFHQKAQATFIDPKRSEFNSPSFGKVNPFPFPYFISMIPGQAYHELKAVRFDHDSDSIDYFFKESFGLKLGARKTFLFNSMYGKNYARSGLPGKSGSDLVLESVIVEMGAKSFTFPCSKRWLRVLGNKVWCKIAGKDEYYTSCINHTSCINLPFIPDTKKPKLDVFKPVSKKAFESKLAEVRAALA